MYRKAAWFGRTHGRTLRRASSSSRYRARKRGSAQASRYFHSHLPRNACVAGVGRSGGTESDRSSSDRGKMFLAYRDAGREKKLGAASSPDRLCPVLTTRRKSEVPGRPWGTRDAESALGPSCRRRRPAAYNGAADREDGGHNGKGGKSISAGNEPKWRRQRQTSSRTASYSGDFRQSRDFRFPRKGRFPFLPEREGHCQRWRASRRRNNATFGNNTLPGEERRTKRAQTKLQNSNGADKLATFALCAPLLIRTGRTSVVPTGRSDNSERFASGWL